MTYGPHTSDRLNGGRTHAMTTVARPALVALTTFLFTATALSTSPAFAQTARPGANGAAGAAARAIVAPRILRKDEVEAGALLIETITPGEYLAAPLVAANVDMNITGPVIRTRLTQRFTNPTDQWVEGVYAFPLPESAAVDTLKIVIGDRFIEGQVKERQEARLIYEDAAAHGLRAGLVEQERPNLFTTSVANIGPGETVAIQIEYQDKPRLVDGQWTTRFPLVVAPRYNPPAAGVIHVADLAPRTEDAQTASSANVSAVKDTGRITPPVLHPHSEPDTALGLRLPVSFNITLDAGFALETIGSSSHGLKIDMQDADTATVTLAADEVPADKDFTLNWTAAPSAAPTAGVFSQTRNGDNYVLAFIAPPAGLGDNAPRQDRETIFVIDNSGSMSGESMRQAKTGLLLGLDRLSPDDEFNIIRFDDTMELVFPGAVAATPDNIRKARRFVGSLEADGGTEMLPALKAALIDNDAANADEVRQVVFITDGAIGNENALFAAITQGLGRSRLFTVGIGSAPNSHFMTRAARMGRGAFTYVDDINQVAAQTDRLFRALERPVMTDLSISFPTGMNLAAYPSPLPDLYEGEPVSLIARADTLSGAITLSGRMGDTPWSASLPLDKAAHSNGLATLWGRARIADLEESRFDGASMDAVDKGVLQTALDYGLVSRLTSLVAVDVTPARPANETLNTRQIATMLPAGWDFAAVFGDRAEARARAQDKLPPDILAAIPRQGRVEAGARNGLDLPQTSAGWQAMLLMGLGLLILGVVASRRSPFDRKNGRRRTPAAE